LFDHTLFLTNVSTKLLFKHALFFDNNEANREITIILN